MTRSCCTTSPSWCRALRAGRCPRLQTCRISSPPVSPLSPASTGIDTDQTSEQTVPPASHPREITRHRGFDSPGLPEPGRHVEGAHDKAANFCTACFDGNYPDSDDDFNSLQQADAEPAGIAPTVLEQTTPSLESTTRRRASTLENGPIKVSAHSRDVSAAVVGRPGP